jgi:hypothetical protein
MIRVFHSSSNTSISTSFVPLSFASAIKKVMMLGLLSVCDLNELLPLNPDEMYWHYKMRMRNKTTYNLPIGVICLVNSPSLFFLDISACQLFVYINWSSGTKNITNKINDRSVCPVPFVPEAATGIGVVDWLLWSWVMMWVESFIHSNTKNDALLFTAAAAVAWASVPDW